jgi:sulfate/thiosulfate transport system permease protein
MIAAAAPIRAKRVLPGFTLSLGTTLLYLTLIVLIPVLALILKGAEIGPARFWQIVSSPRAVAAFQITLTAAVIATVSTRSTAS